MERPGVRGRIDESLKNPDMSGRPVFRGLYQRIKKRAANPVPRRGLDRIGAATVAGRNKRGEKMGCRVVRCVEGNEKVWHFWGVFMIRLGLSGFKFE